MRLFLGLSIPSPIVAQLYRRLEEVKKVLSARTWVRPENVHITLVFLGEVQPETAEAIHSRLLEVARQTSSFSLHLKGWGAFPDMNKPNLLWAGVDGDRDTLAQLVHTLHEHIHPVYPLRRDKRYLPHVTLTRRLQTGRPLPHLNEAYPLQTGKWTVDRMHLYLSHLSPQGARYEIWKTYPFHS